tara:strand:- start:38089 stop:39747 length:1659 start_codon:yes stop_codon:yes gene_type:complete
MTTSGVSVKYGNYVMEPAPLLSYSREVFRTANNEEIIGGLYTISLEGTLWPPGRDAKGPDGPKPLFDSKNDLMTAFNQDYKRFLVEFSGTDGCRGSVVCGHPHIASLTVDSPDNWSRRGNYSIELVFGASSISGTGDFIGGWANANTVTGMLQSLDVDHSVEYLRKPYDYGGNHFGPVIQVNRNITAQGLPIGTGDSASFGLPGTPGYCNTGEGIGWDGFSQASRYVSGLVLGDGNSLSTGEIDLTDNIFSIIDGKDAEPRAYLTNRSVTANKRGGNVSLSDEFILIFKKAPFASTTGDGGVNDDFPVIDNFNLDASQSIENGIHTITMAGDVQGINNYRVASGQLVKIDTAFENASGYLEAVISHSGFFNRAAELYSGSLVAHFPGRDSLPLNEVPNSQSYGYNIGEGTISYSFDYNTRPQNCYSGALSENISITQNRPTDVHASLTILGRQAGPILQAINTVTAWTTELSIEAVIIPYTGCGTENAKGHLDLWVNAPTGATNGYDAFVDAVSGSILEKHGQVFKTSDSESWDIKAGRYTRSVGWIHAPCD